MRDGIPVPVMVRGTLYPSQKACARAHGVNVSTLRSHFERWGHLDRLGLKRSLTSKPVEVDGIVYPSRTAAVRQTGIPMATLVRMLRDGRARDLSGGGDA